MPLPEDWKKLQVPLGLVVAVLMAWVGLYGWARSELVWADDFKQTVQSMELRGLEKDKKTIDNEIFKLEVKKDALPKQFDAVDRAYLEKRKVDLKDVNKEIREVKERGLTK